MHNKKNVIHLKVHDRGQIVIPASVRKKYRIEIGETVDLEDRDNYIILKPSKKKSLMDLAGSVKSNKPFPSRKTIKRIVSKEFSKDGLD